MKELIDVFMALVLLNTQFIIEKHAIKAPIKSWPHKIGKTCPVADGQICSLQW